MFARDIPYLQSSCKLLISDGRGELGEERAEGDSEFFYCAGKLRSPEARIGPVCACKGWGGGWQKALQPGAVLANGPSYMVLQRVGY